MHNNKHKLLFNDINPSMVNNNIYKSENNSLNRLKLFDNFKFGLLLKHRINDQLLNQNNGDKKKNKQPKLNNSNKKEENNQNSNLHQPMQNYY
jgi:hypothetical protein